MMAPARARSPSTRPSAVVALLLILVSSARGFPSSHRDLDTAVDGVQRYLESSGFPKMTRGEVVGFLNGFSRSSRAGRAGKTGDRAGKTGDRAEKPTDDATGVVAASQPETPAAAVPKIPDSESPLNYGYPMSLQNGQKSGRTTGERGPAESTTSMIFVTMPTAGPAAGDREKSAARELGGRSAPKKSAIPSSDPNAYAEFKRIPEAKNLKIDDEMKAFLNGFGLLDAAAESGEPSADKQQLRRRNDVDAADEKRLLKSVLVETGAVDANASEAAAGPFIASISKSDHVFNPTGAEVRTVDVNRIAKIVENIRLLTDDNNTVSLPQEVIQKKLENITAAISAIDRPEPPAGAAADGFDGYEVFFDDSSKEVDSDLPADAPAAGPEDVSLAQAQNPPDPLSVDELQQLLEKHKSDVKRQQPPTETTADATTAAATATAAAATTTAASAEPDADAVSTSSEAVTTERFLEATSFKGASEAPAPGDDASASASASTSTTAASNPSLSLLAESFGGGETASNAPAPEDLGTTAAPNRPKNGLYFYVDWNSFLTVNSGQRNQVNLRFAPKAGNPAHFLRVTVP